MKICDLSKIFLCASSQVALLQLLMGLMFYSLFALGISSTNFWANRKYFLPVSQTLLLSYCLEISDWSLLTIDLPPQNVLSLLIPHYMPAQHTDLSSQLLMNVAPFLQQVGSSNSFPSVLSFIVIKISFHLQIIPLFGLTSLSQRAGNERSEEEGCWAVVFYFSETRRTVGNWRVWQSSAIASVLFLLPIRFFPQSPAHVCLYMSGLNSRFKIFKTWKIPVYVIRQYLAKWNHNTLINY